MKNAGVEDNDFLDLYTIQSSPYGGEGRRNQTFGRTIVLVVGPGGVVGRAQSGASEWVGGRDMSSIENTGGVDDVDFLDLYTILSPPSGGEGQGNQTYGCTILWGVVGFGGVVQFGGGEGSCYSDWSVGRTRRQELYIHPSGFHRHLFCLPVRAERREARGWGE